MTDNFVVSFPFDHGKLEYLPEVHWYSNKEVISLYNTAVSDFASPLVSNDKITLHSKDLQLFGNTGKLFCNQYSFDFLVQNVLMTWTVTYGTNPGDLQTITYGNYLNLLLTYAPDKVERPKTYASAIWGDRLFTL